MKTHTHPPTHPPTHLHGGDVLLHPVHALLGPHQLLLWRCIHTKSIISI
jgi:hypothetical protein